MVRNCGPYELFNSVGNQRAGRPADDSTRDRSISRLRSFSTFARTRRGTAEHRRRSQCEGSRPIESRLSRSGLPLRSGISEVSINPSIAFRRRARSAAVAGGISKAFFLMILLVADFLRITLPLRKRSPPNLIEQCNQLLSPQRIQPRRMRDSTSEMRPEVGDG